MEKRMDNHLIPYFQKYRVVSVTTELVLKFTNEKLKTLKPATVNRMLSHVSHAFRLAFELQKVSKVPLIKRLEERNRRKGFFERAEFSKVYVHLPADIKPIAELGYFSGMRAGELLSLLYEQVDIARCCIRLEETKNGDPREIYYGENPELKSLIDLQWEHKLETEKRTGASIQYLFFRYSTGKPVKDFRVCWKNACSKAGIKKVKGLKDKSLFHNLRRTACRNLIRSGVAESTAQLISGHESRSTFDRYNIRDPKLTRSALAKVSLSFSNVSHSSAATVDSQIDSQISESKTQVMETNDLQPHSSRRLQ